MYEKIFLTTYYISKKMFICIFKIINNYARLSTINTAINLFIMIIILEFFRLNGVLYVILF